MSDEPSISKPETPLGAPESIDRLCDEFEQALGREPRPEIERLLTQTDPAHRATALRELLKLEVEYLRQQELPFERNDYLARFASLANVVNAVFDDQESLFALPDSKQSTRSIEQQQTADHPGQYAAVPDCEQTSDPEQIGRYQIRRKLGGGAFGRVYLAHDGQLDRLVAIKVPSQRLFESGRSVEVFLDEARSAAKLKHPRIVAVHDVQIENGQPYVVQEYVDGTNLADWISAKSKDGQVPPQQAVTLLIDIAEAVGAAHEGGLVHRDLKPANILLDSRQQPHVADFGMALHESVQRQRKGERSGTPVYMSPEQVRGESHLLDGRTDLWSLGVMLYELLVGRRPFGGESTDDLYDEIEYREPRPPSMVRRDPAIDAELERICLKCLQKKAKDRYASAARLIEDLQHWLDTRNQARGGDAFAEKTPATSSTTETSATVPARVVPKGLRSFDAKDADFFLDLLPDPRDRDGLPDTIRFWKSLIEQTDPDETFRVGLIYGPSGCGKSSFVKAGLIPHLDDGISICIEATPDETERRLLKGIAKHCPEAPEEADLVDVVRSLRERETDEPKVLLVIDQFEQWLYAHRHAAGSELVKALRQCDGGRVQCILLVRDDFWMAISEFMDQLDVPMVEGGNSAAVNLFDLPHARKVLIALGRAYGRLPEDPTAELTDEQAAFVERAVKDLSREGKVICVRLSLFADMMKGRPWTPGALKKVGGTEGVGVTFLEETFSASTAPPQHRLHAKAAPAVLAALLPEAGTEIKGHMRSRDELISAANYQQRAEKFDQLLRILDQDLRLITPTDPEAVEVEDEAAASAGESEEKYYQLTHDYLVPSLRQWLTRKQKETRRGRAELQLAERAALWNAKPEHKQLPGIWEYLRLRTLTDSHKWTDGQRRMMSAAARCYVTRGAALLVLVAMLSWGGREAFSRFNADNLVKSLINASPDKVAQSVANVQPYLSWARPELERSADLDPKTDDERRQRLHARLALVGEDNGHLTTLLQSLLEAKPEYLGAIRDVLSPYRTQISDQLWEVLHDASADSAQRFRAGLVLANYEAAADQWRDADYRFLVEQLLSSFAEYQPAFRKYLAPIAPECLSDFERNYVDADSTEQIQVGAALAIAEFARDDQQRIAKLLRVATPQQYEVLYPLIASNPTEEVKTELAQISRQLPPEDMSSLDRVTFGKQRAGAAITLLRLGERDRVLPVFDLTDDPEAMTQFIHRSRQRRVTAGELLELLRLVVDQPSSNPPRARYALLLALGDYSLDELPVSDHPQLLSDLADWYANDASSAVHGATGWLLRQWGQDDVVQRVDQTPVPYSPDREWFTLKIVTRPPVKIKGADSTDNENEQSTDETVKDDAQPPSENSTDESDNDSSASEQGSAKDQTDDAAKEAAQDGPSDEGLETEDTEFVPQTFYMTFVVFQPGTYTVGSPEDQPDWDNDESVHDVVLTRPFALLDREVTFAEMIACQQSGAVPYDYEGLIPHYGSSADTAVMAPDWYDAVRYCRWLTQQLGRSEDEQCYPDPATLDVEEFPLDDRAGAPRDWPLRDLAAGGFRLPTEHEWEVACRVGSRVSYGFGGDAMLLGHYGWFVSNSSKSLQIPKTRRPSLRGLFDMHGNVFEWCHDWYRGYPSDTLTDPLGPSEGSSRVGGGGSWSHGAARCRSSYRSGYVPSARLSYLGFRLALSPSSKDAERGDQERVEAVDPTQAEPGGS